MESPIRPDIYDQLLDYQARMDKFLKELDSKGITGVTAIVMAGDMSSAERVSEDLKAGRLPTDKMPLDRIPWLVGSYTRFAWALDNMPREWVLRNLLELWRGSDPDDTRREYLGLFEQACDGFGVAYLRDGKALPRPRRLYVYRGQSAAETAGIAWTLDRKIAEGFAQGMGTRQHRSGGIVKIGQAYRDDILAYITERGEEEVIIDPAQVLVFRDEVLP